MTAHATTAAPWRLLPLEVGPPEALVDGSVALLDGLAEDPRPVLRWYRAASTAVVLGRGQRLPEPAAGTNPRPAPHVEVLMRHSGGGAVLLDPWLLSLDIVLPPHHPLLEGDLTAVFDRVGRAWAAALASLGVGDLSVHSGPGTARRRGSDRERLLAAVCYATIGRGEVLTGGRKLVGLSQRRRRQGALVQCGLLRRWRPATLLAALGADPDDAEIAAAAVGLEELGLSPIDDHRVIAAVSDALRAG